MDVFSHGLWAAAAYKAANRNGKIAKGGRPLRVWLAAAFGVAPDVFAFAVPAVWIFIRMISGDVRPTDFPHPGSGETLAENNLWIFRLASALYSVSHSAIIFFVAFLVVFAVLRRPVWEMGAWLFHILLDILTHSSRFYPTPVFWPLSDWKFLHGFSWATPWFLLANYAALAFVFAALWRRKRKTR